MAVELDRARSGRPGAHGDHDLGAADAALLAVIAGYLHGVGSTNRADPGHHRDAVSAS